MAVLPSWKHLRRPPPGVFTDERTAIYPDCPAPIRAILGVLHRLVLSVRKHHHFSARSEGQEGEGCEEQGVALMGSGLVPQGSTDAAIGQTRGDRGHPSAPDVRMLPSSSLHFICGFPWVRASSHPIGCPNRGTGARFPPFTFEGPSSNLSPRSLCPLRVAGERRPPTERTLPL